MSVALHCIYCGYNFRVSDEYVETYNSIRCWRCERTFSISGSGSIARRTSEQARIQIDPDVPRGPRPGNIPNRYFTPEIVGNDNNEFNGFIREELNLRLISVVPDSILMDVINSISNQISLRMQRDMEDFRPTLNLRCTIDDRRNGLYVVPIECKRCKFIFYINNSYPPGAINLHCPRCGKEVDQGVVQNSKVPNKTKTIVKEEVKEDEGRRIRCEGGK